MPSQETPAIILSVKDYGEADRLVTFLTPTRGRLTGVAKHARKSKKRFAHCLEPLSRVTLFLSDRANHRKLVSVKSTISSTFFSLETSP